MPRLARVTVSAADRGGRGTQFVDLAGDQPDADHDATAAAVKPARPRPVSFTVSHAGSGTIGVARELITDQQSAVTGTAKTTDTDINLSEPADINLSLNMPRECQQASKGRGTPRLQKGPCQAFDEVSKPFGEHLCDRGDEKEKDCAVLLWLLHVADAPQDRLVKHHEQLNRRDYGRCPSYAQMTAVADLLTSK